MPLTSQAGRENKKRAAMTESQNENSGPPSTIELERRRITAECRRFELECLDLEHRISQPWYRGRFVLEAVTGGIVVAGLLAAWTIAYMQPILSRKQEIASLDAIIQAKINERDHLQNESKAGVLERDNHSIREQLGKLSSLNTALMQQQTEAEKHVFDLQTRLADQEEALTKRSTDIYLSQWERQEITRLAQQARDARIVVNAQLARLHAEQRVTITNAEIIAASVLRAALRDSVWRITCPYSGSPSSFVQLRADGVLGCNPYNAASFHFSGADTWQTRELNLIITWSAGYSTQVFAFSSPDAVTANGGYANSLNKCSITKLQ
jgi:hypothetical protein